MESEVPIIKEMRQEIKSLNLLLSQKNDLLRKYDISSNSAEEKIKAINILHSEKVKALMNSIQSLKKEIALLKKQATEHRRSDLIARLNKDIGEQDLIIETLRKMIGNDDKADKEIIKSLNKVPNMIRVQSREEMKMEIKRLKSRGYSGQVKKAPIDIPKLRTTDEEEAPLELEESKVSVESKGDRFLEEEIKRLTEKVAKLEAEKEGLVDNRNKMEAEFNSRKGLAVDLETLRSEHGALLKKFGTMKRELEEIKSEGKEHFVMNFDKELKLSELEIISKTQEARIKAAEDSAQLQMEIMTHEISELQASKAKALREMDEVKLESESRKRQLKSMETQLKVEAEEKEKAQTALENVQEEYEAKLEVKIKEIEEITRELRDAKRNEVDAKEFAKLKEEEYLNQVSLLEVVKEEKKTIEEELRNRLKDTIEIKTREIDVAHQENVALREKLKNITKNSISLQATVEEQADEILFLNGEIARLKQNIPKSKSESESEDDSQSN